ncbi:hypothetical protein Tco_0270925 [Tanacetum coccineum]
MKESSKTAGGRRKKSLARKRARENLSEESTKKQKLEDDTEKEELQVFLNIVPEEESLNVESLATKYLIVDWETQILANDKYYYQIKRADGWVKTFQIFSIRKVILPNETISTEIESLYCQLDISTARLTSEYCCLCELNTANET